MLTLNNITVRPLEMADVDALYSWEQDIELNILAGYLPLLSRTAFRRRFEQHINEPKDTIKWFAIVYEDQLVGSLQLGKIDYQHRSATFGIALGVKALWGHGIGSTALRLLLDYAFTVLNLERIYCEVWSFNQRSQQLMEHIGMQREGILRQHEVHNGKRQDLYFYGILKPEFYQRYQTIFKLAD